MTWTDSLRALPMQAVYLLDQPLVRLGPVGFRGALGSALMDVVCVRDHRNCQACDVRVGCTVPGWFDPGRLGSNLPRPVAIRSVDIDPTRHVLSVSLVLHGELRDRESLVASLRRAGRLGFGKARAPGVLTQLIAWDGGTGALVVDGGQSVSSVPDPPALTRLLAAGSAVGLRLLSPARVDRPNTRPTGALLIASAIRRLRALAEAQGAVVDRRWPDPGDIHDLRTELTRVDATRWSERQRARIDLSGWVGELECEGLESFQDLLAAAEVLQIGKYTSAGLGVVERIGGAP